DGGPFRVDAAAELPLDPVTGFARIAPDDEPERTVPSHRAHERGAKPGDGFMIEGIIAGLASDAVGPEKSRHLLDRHRNDGRVNRHDPEGLRRIHLNPKIVPARTEPGKVHEGLDTVASERRKGILRS